MKTSKRLLFKQGLKNKLVSYSFKTQQPSLMQNQYPNWSCVLDPAIALSHNGVLIAESISKEIDLWVVQELWNIVNDAKFYSSRTELIIPSTIAFKEASRAEVVWSLKEWSRTKQEKDLSKLGMYWLGDNLQESLLPKDKPVELYQQWQASASALDRRNEVNQNNDSEILNLAFRDTIALAVSLKSAFVLTYQPSTDSDSSPAICKALENWGISSQIINQRNPIVAMERQYIRQLIVRAGLSKLLLVGVNLVAFHLAIPSVVSSAYRDISHDLDRESYFWNNVKGVWYYL